MSVDAQKEHLGFQAEVSRLLDLVAKSLYSNSEIFLRELVSNASDAADKLRYLALEDPALFEGDGELKIWLTLDKDAKTLTIRDNGIGMSREEVIENLGTIAKSGTKAFLDQLAASKDKVDSQLIGQFGVGFYSAFVVADKVEVITRRAGLTSEHGVKWVSDGKEGYTLENVACDTRGTAITLHLNKDSEDFLDEYRLRSIVKKYSDHITLPIMMEKSAENADDEDKKDKKKEKAVEWEQVNRATALWMMPKSDIKDDEYEELYKHISHDFEGPLAWSHNKVEGKLEYTSLLYVPKRAPFDLYQREQARGLKLYVQRVFIMDNAEQFMPMYLRFVKGIIDSNDLPLNISREILQSDRTVESIKAALTKRVLDMLEKMAKNEPQKYDECWQVFGKVLKEGPAEDFTNRERIAKLLRFATTHTDSEKQTVSLEDYVARMPESQTKIYYVSAESFQAAQHSPHLEIFRKKGIEVLLLSEPVDEWLVSHLMEFEGKSLHSVARGDLDLGDMDDKETKEQQKEAEKTYESTLKQAKEVLGEAVKEVRLTHRLTDSPACVVADENDMNANMQRIMAAMGQAMPEVKPILELNPGHALIKRLRDEADDARFADLAHILFDQSVLAEGGQLKDPASFVKRVNKLL
ncbi:MAG: molecular chaperone HtpG [Gammaproteobacteria bacterium CG11_big_fil_rev_8_21_14_0_20_46_22]|nr:MAG: molecular chaperone HtpG [Gammaproteobacteria bacterium CG12_big_fil_rev_8_21_14_0_65_46_12]PIR11923.1 MAG: molecular chaperone HtpG [Gammaproteobacteria bacterium CG11_big_fil_rev_8_21_14_0_20_46_22]